MKALLNPEMLEKFFEHKALSSNKKDVNAKPDWCDVDEGSGVAVPRPTTQSEKQFAVKKLETRIRKPNQQSLDGFGLFDTQEEMFK